ncbi:MAG: endonuclease/exonuclease/phosphatase family protein [Nitrospinota bacterium]|nr:endonuclease/exonuclease/phosphatase family protein [Nitrospinota bacterium]MDP7663609.1 endonuclease/exonuclease/phosphatase family protein [Nitrospinota bacterium]
MRLISWNTNARTRRVAHLVEFLRKRKPDLIALQEVTPNSVPLFREGFREIGLPFIHDSFESFRNSSLLKGPRRYGVMIASRYPVGLIRRKNFRVPWKEKFLSVSIEGPEISFDLHAAYIPPGSTNGWKKVETLEGIYRGLSRKTKRPRILCGDFNAPQEEYPSGEIVTWAQRIRSDGEAVTRKRFRNGDGARWDAAERNIMAGLGKYDLPDVYRALRGWEARDFSWYPIRKKTKAPGRRFDHIFASDSLNAVRCRYLEAARVNRLSDHSPIEADFSLNDRIHV